MVIIFFSVDVWTERLDSNQVIEQLALNYIFIRPINRFLNRHVAKRVILEKSQYVLEPYTLGWAAGSFVGDPEDISTPYVLVTLAKTRTCNHSLMRGTLYRLSYRALNPGLKSTNKQVIVEHIARYAGTAPSVPAFTYGPLTHLFRLPCNYLS